MPSDIHVLVLGSAPSEGKSCFLVKAGQTSFILDCGYMKENPPGKRFPDFQHKDMRSLGIKITDVDFVVITHSHLDHCGGLPLLLGQFQYKNPVFATKSTASLIPSAYADMMRVDIRDKEDLEFNLTPSVIHHTCSALRPMSMQQTVRVSPTVSLTFLPAGHTVGAACALVQTPDGNVFYSGDMTLHACDNLPLPQLPLIDTPIDIAIVESTFIETMIAPQSPRRALESASVFHTLMNGGHVLAPCSAQSAFPNVCADFDIMCSRNHFESVPLYAIHGLSRRALTLLHARSADVFTYQNSWEGKASRFAMQNFYNFPTSITKALKRGPWLAVATPASPTCIGASADIFMAIADDSASQVLLRGTTKRATDTWRLLRRAARNVVPQESSSRCKKPKHFGTLPVECRVTNRIDLQHTGFVGIATLLRSLNAANVLLVHGKSVEVCFALDPLKECLRVRPLGEQFPRAGAAHGRAGELPRVEMLVEKFALTSFTTDPRCFFVEIYGNSSAVSTTLFPPDTATAPHRASGNRAAVFSTEPEYGILARVRSSVALAEMSEAVRESGLESNIDGTEPAEPVNEIQILGTSLRILPSTEGSVCICAIDDVPVLSGLLRFQKRFAAASE
eukprot:gnl/Chilomastix_cuspidata/2760.p1 GENE.gnl/Chilomastix_cuspidata/2760~~gnl/Chilomastix_cuspidata/2760.p1  ORF type:complete len:621 (+),score=73.84 gnl/Chilomastix_cuspidata/2760:31-1893(+)